MNKRGIRVAKTARILFVNKIIANKWSKHIIESSLLYMQNNQTKKSQPTAAKAFCFIEFGQNAEKDVCIHNLIKMCCFLPCFHAIIIVCAWRYFLVRPFFGANLKNEAFNL